MVSRVYSHLHSVESGMKARVATSLNKVIDKICINFKIATVSFRFHLLIDFYANFQDRFASDEETDAEEELSMIAQYTRMNAFFKLANFIQVFQNFKICRMHDMTRNTKHGLWDLMHTTFTQYVRDGGKPVRVLTD